ncbi:hypothetical protein N1031_06720 [Herbiconiux moechotypicola]|uniref:hypothetical protein n=1 Tax=Herbiconiux moechotypicola TaxID=637393 RepID=UPI00217D9D5A|nr:hypothetical protein [Herbiconiux moechotypicola]MCS5729451.1 hypothetical protein [Herbiconiux moechotypicola]
MVLPLVIMTVADDDTMNAVVDGVPYLPAAFAPPWRRDSFAMILDQLTARHRTPLRVEVREADGTVFTDIITPARTRTLLPAQTPDPEPAADPPPVPAAGVLVGLVESGFVPGEDIAVAVVIGHSDAAPDGTARGLLTRTQLAASPTREVILLGRVSGTLTIGHPE